MMNKEDVITLLRDGVVSLEFTKSDGSIRTMRCTLAEGLVPETIVDESKPKRAVNPDVQAVWDLEVEGWRSFRWDRLLSASKEVEVETV
jgi:hypothetical protein